MNNYDLFSRDTKAFIYGAQTTAVQRMLDFDYLCRKDEPSVVAMITPERGGFEKFFWGTREIAIPRLRSISEAVIRFPEPSIAYAVQPKSKGDDEKISTALNKLTEEDPVLQVGRDPQTGEMLVKGSSQQHVEIAISKMK